MKFKETFAMNMRMMTLLTIAAILFCAPPAQGQTYTNYPIRCLKSGRTYEQGEEPPRTRFIGCGVINADDLWPRMGQILILQLLIEIEDQVKIEDEIRIVDKVKDAEIMYDLRATPGIRIIEKPLLSSWRFKTGDYVLVRVPIEIMDDQKPQDLKIHVVGYLDGVLKDWSDNDIQLCHGTDILKTSADRKPYLDQHTPLKLPGYTNQPVFVYNPGR